MRPSDPPCHLMTPMGYVFLENFITLTLLLLNEILINKSKKKK